MATSSSSHHRPPPSPILELVLTVVLPSLVLDYLSEAARLGPFWALIVSMLFPIAFGIWCWQQKLGWNLFSTLGLVTILLSGGLGLLKLDAFWFSVKESSMLLIIGMAFPLSHRWGRPLIDAIVLQPHLINLQALHAALQTPEQQRSFDRVRFRASLWLGLGMTVSGGANFFLAMWILGGKIPGSAAFLKGIATLNWVSMIVLGAALMVLMLMVLMWLLRRLRQITGLERADLMNPGRTVRRQVVNSLPE